MGPDYTQMTSSLNPWNPYGLGFRKSTITNECAAQCYLMGQDLGVLKSKQGALTGPQEL